MAVQTSATSRSLLPWLVAVAFFMEALDTTILNTAIPVMAKALGVAPLSMKAVLASYTLSLAVFIPVSGWIADRFGTRRTFAAAIGIFTIGSICCGLSTEIHWLVASRILQGMGGALMLPVGRLTMVKTFPKSELVRAMSFVALPGLIGPMLGPLAGGLIVTHFHWSVIFFVNVPIGLVGLYMVYRHLPDFREPRSPFDLVGFILFGSGIALLSYVLEVFGEHTLSGREMLALLAIAGVLLAGYAINSQRLAHPLLRMALFKIRTLRAAISGSFFSRLGIGGVPFLFPLLYQAGLGFSATHAGLLMMVPATAAFSLKLSMPRVLARFGYRSILMFNTVTLGLMIMLFATIGAETPIWLIVIQLFLFGACASLQYTSMNTLVYADVPDKDAGAASTIASTSQQLSVSFAVALASLAAAVFVPEALRSDPPALIGGIHKAFLMLGALTVVSAVVFMRLKPDDGNAVSRKKVVLPTEVGSG